ncbi:caspase family protein [Polycyclovorans algicola]|uniref:caspase family protein n=1 Tax=Polycyclovorans algicola TaxID=616992 RepID=UPI0004A71EA1|nr:caspase family protein [Polycyclovorans algicola]
MKMKCAVVKLSVIALSLLFSAAASASQKVALVIGNDRYERAPQLANAGNDATDIGAKLKELGFSLVGNQVHQNVSLVQLNRLVRDLAEAAAPGDTALFYFAGHGIAGDGDNFLLPVDDGGLTVFEDVPDYALSLQRVLQRIGQRGSGINLVILDACRDNPLPSRTRSSSTVGLTRVAAPLGTLIAYAADEGQAAMDGRARNGLFTGALLEVLTVPGLRVDDALAEVTRRVREASNGQQVPVRESNLESVLYFIPPARQGSNAELALWEQIREQPNPDRVRQYLQSYPEGQFAELARLMLQPSSTAPQQTLDVGTIDFDRLNQTHRQMKLPDDIRGLLDPQLVSKLESDPFFNFPFETRTLSYEKTIEYDLDLQKIQDGAVTQQQVGSGMKIVADGLPGILRYSSQTKTESMDLSTNGVVAMGGLLSLISISDAGIKNTEKLVDVQTSGKVFPLGEGERFAWLQTVEPSTAIEGFPSKMETRNDCQVTALRSYGNDFPAPGFGYGVVCESRNLFGAESSKVTPMVFEYLFISEIGQFIQTSFQPGAQGGDHYPLAIEIMTAGLMGTEPSRVAQRFTGRLQECNNNLRRLEPKGISDYEACSARLLSES